MTRKDVSKLSPGEDLVESLGIDSLAGLRVLAAVEKRLDLRFPDERLSEFRTMDSVLSFMEGQIGKENS